MIIIRPFRFALSVLLGAAGVTAALFIVAACSGSGGAP
jgi:hypothetical protein